MKLKTTLELGDCTFTAWDTGHGTSVLRVVGRYDKAVDVWIVDNDEYDLTELGSLEDIIHADSDWQWTNVDDVEETIGFINSIEHLLDNPYLSKYKRNEFQRIKSLRDSIIWQKKDLVNWLSDYTRLYAIGDSKFISIDSGAKIFKIEFADKITVPKPEVYEGLF